MFAVHSLHFKTVRPKCPSPFTKGTWKMILLSLEIIFKGSSAVVGVFVWLCLKNEDLYEEHAAKTNLKNQAS